MTVDKAFVLLTGRLDRHDTYVLALRSTGGTRWHCAGSSINQPFAPRTTLPNEIDGAGT
jgi:hypothetical protein